MARAGALPIAQATEPFLRRLPCHSAAALQTDRRRISSRFLGVSLNTSLHSGDFRDRHDGEPAVGLATDSPQQGLTRGLLHEACTPTDPDRNRSLDRQRVQPESLDLVESRIDRRRFFGPEATKGFDLVVTACAPAMVVLAHRRILLATPADPDSQSKSSSR